MPDIGATFGYLGQGQAALDLTGAARGFDQRPGVLSGLRLLDTVSGIVGIDRISGQLAKYAVKLALKSDQASLHAAQEMVELMRSRVPQDTGALLNGISYRREGGFYVVEATADRGGYDYALAVEAGHHAGGSGLADADMFADTTGRGGQRARGSSETDVAAQPFFYGSAREALSDWASELGGSIGSAAREEGL
ncbi:HK97 gp10 family phage protein [Methylobacterium brachiatum]|uniref:HK97 gp10 family phage protein n=1 Tax=Methylobacterium brachiatum TaxID=269660 RepID=UPI0013CF3790|nr:HK97 gp10 family phage protein [Methylobacterium brachiatum]